MNEYVNYLLAICVVSIVGIVVVLYRRRYRDKALVNAVLNLAAIPVLSQVYSEFELEITRARRLGHSLCVMVVRGQTQHSINPPQASNVAHFPLATSIGGSQRHFSLQELSACSRTLREQMRDLDAISFDGVRGQFVIVMPGANRKQALWSMDRVNKKLGPELANELAVGVAEFPNNGLFLEDLIESACDCMGQRSDSSGFNLRDVG